MTIHDLLEYVEQYLREDNEYWEQMDKFRADIDKLINRLALEMLTGQSCKCADCTGGYCEDDCMEALDALDSVLDDMLDEALNEE